MTMITGNPQVYLAGFDVDFVPLAHYDERPDALAAIQAIHQALEQSPDVPSI